MRPAPAPGGSDPVAALRAQNYELIGENRKILAALAAGLVALISLPREEEPQISVPMVDIMVRADGLKAEDAVKLVTEPLETIIKSIDGVEHVYSQTRDDNVMVTARFLVGTSSDAAILRVHEKVRANLNRIPVGIPEPLIVGRGIDDVAIVVITLIRILGFAAVILAAVVAATAVAAGAGATDARPLRRGAGRGARRAPAPRGDRGAAAGARSARGRTRACPLQVLGGLRAPRLLPARHWERLGVSG